MSELEIDDKQENRSESAEASSSTRFKPGKSGNPRGRPKKEQCYPTDVQIFYDIVSTMEQEITVTPVGRIDSRSRSISQMGRRIKEIRTTA